MGVLKTARKMETALRDDGTKGYAMTARSEAWFVERWKKERVLGDGRIGGKTININADRVFKSKSALRWTLGHESAHNAGIHDHWYKHEPGYHTMTQEQSLDNADSYMDFISR